MLAGAVSLLALNACSDFDEVNANPLKVTSETVKPYYSMNAAIKADQQNPNDAERVFVLYWAAIAHQDGENGSSIACGDGNDEWRGCAMSFISKALTRVNEAITLCDANVGAASDHEKAFYPNLKQMARIYRAYLLTELSDCFGPVSIDGFQGETPTFSSVKDVYYYALQELSEAVDAIDTSIQPSEEEAKNDVVYGYNAEKWKNYGISMRMRLAMRLSEVDASKAQSEFEAAVKQGQGIRDNKGNFLVQESGGWDDWTGVMSRVWNWQTMSATLANLTTNFGGAKSVKALKKFVNDSTVYDRYVKDASTHAGIKNTEIWAEYTDNPTKQLWFDGLPEYTDPRALYFYHLPGDYKNRKVNGYMSQPKYEATEISVAGKTVDLKYNWNGLPCGWGLDDVATQAKNAFWLGEKGGMYWGHCPQLCDEVRNCTAKRVFFGAWETYFLLAEAAVRGWSVGISAEEAYNQGIKASFDYNGMSDLYSAYINSENYNRVGTSVKFSHTVEPQPTQMSYIDGTTGQKGTLTYQYPNANNILYKGHKLNDALTKIITQLYIANTPWLPLENWSNHRRLGLPFFEIPVSVTSITNMPAWTKDSYKGKQTSQFFPQRMQYPASLSNADAAGYAKALELLGGPDGSMTPLWWAIQ